MNKCKKEVGNDAFKDCIFFVMNGHFFIIYYRRCSLVRFIIPCLIQCMYMYTEYRQKIIKCTVSKVTAIKLEGGGALMARPLRKELFLRLP